MKTKFPALHSYFSIQTAASASNDGHRCLIAPHPKLKKKLQAELKRFRELAGDSVFANSLTIRESSRPGFNDGLIYPGEILPLGTALTTAKNMRLSKKPLRGIVRVVVVLVDFSDKPLRKSKAHFEDLFFSKDKISTGSVSEYFHEVTNGLVDIQGQVVGPYRLPLTLREYANNASGTGEKLPNARTMARDAARMADPNVNFSLYDNDKDGYVDAFVVIHAGTGAETNNSRHDIWSHKWVLQGGAYESDRRKRVYSYLTVPEDCKLGVCAHELGHLLFGFPDLYDSDYSSEGVGDWCLMGGGSWNNNGLTPAHPSSWCKCQQGWVEVKTPSKNQKNLVMDDVKKSNVVYKLWKNGKPAREYFLLENRQKDKFDKYLPASGLLIWHVDDAVATNEGKRGTHYKVALVQADGKKHLEGGINRGDAGDCFPGKSRKETFGADTTPSSRSHGGVDSKVTVTNIRESGKKIKLDIKIT